MKYKIIFLSIVLALLILMATLARGYPYPADLFPLLISVPLMVLVGAQIALEIRGAQEEYGEQRKAFVADFAKYSKVLFWVVALLILFYVLGHPIGLPLFLFLYLKLHGEGWPASILIAVGMAAIIWGGFGVGLRMQLYNGLIPY